LLESMQPYNSHRLNILAHYRMLRDIIENVMHIFDSLDNKVDDFSKSIEEDDLSTPFDDGSEHKAALVSRFHDELLCSQAEMLAHSIVMLYHQWERSAKTLQLECVLSGIKPEDPKFPHKFLKHLETLGNDFEAACKTIDLARLISNTVKHGDGPSRSALSSKEQSLLQRPWQDDDFPLLSDSSPNQIWVTQDYIITTGKAIELLWTNLPDQYFRPELPADKAFFEGELRGHIT